MQKSNTDDYYRDICKNFMNVDISENDKERPFQVLCKR